MEPRDRPTNVFKFTIGDDVTNCEATELINLLNVGDAFHEGSWVTIGDVLDRCELDVS